ncbi:esterase [Nocardia cyriacigeorgica]|uniref:Esterase n=1 Tax=Nocardia cyriacigeorgica TaxID=135487 RepID=A0A6P1DG64_9NOCA|nr:esterase [Nocardia cyriacigeorgica]NEW42291.1 esterase [Nocardia cyriacigeorgica]NEW47553.1 esterase [Nocardia cyriacigeorgica]NEW53512.1 esterase [Nocardia cyriacigeorgica]NEW58175.1 esterase [Nocardia cyriacigeorgica]
MHQFARRTAGFAMAIAASGLLVAGCGDDDSDTANDTVGSMTSMMAPGETGPMGPGETGHMDHDGSATGTAMPTGTATGGETPGAMGETKINTPNGEIVVSDVIYTKYVETGGPDSPLGAPEEAEESGPNGGRYQDFVGGTIYWSPDSGAHIVWGDIRETWEENGGANGTLGYPVTDEETTADGGKKSEFTGGTIVWVNGQTTVTEK